MNQIIAQEVEKQGWMKRVLTAVSSKLFTGFCTYEIGMCPHETQMFLNYSSYGWEDAAMAQSIVRYKTDDEEVA